MSPYLWINSFDIISNDLNQWLNIRTQNIGWHSLSIQIKSTNCRVKFIDSLVFFAYFLSGLIVDTCVIVYVSGWNKSNPRFLYIHYLWRKLMHRGIFIHCQNFHRFLELHFIYQQIYRRPAYNPLMTVEEGEHELVSYFACPVGCAVEYTDCKIPLTSVLDMTLNNLWVRFQ